MDSVAWRPCQEDNARNAPTQFQNVGSFSASCIDCQIDVTSEVADWVSGAQSSHGFHLSRPAASAPINYEARENTTGPRLIVVWN